MSSEKDLKRLIELQEETLKAQRSGNQTKSLIYYIIVTIFTGGLYWVYQLLIKQPTKAVAASVKYTAKGTIAAGKLAAKGTVVGARVAKSEYEKRKAPK
jgi:hypothetical protein